MRRTMAVGRAAVVAALLVAGAACGDDDGGTAAEGGGDGDGAAEVSSEEQAYVDAMVEGSGMTEGSGAASPEQADCVWSSFVRLVGVDELAAVATAEEVRRDDLDAETVRGLTGGDESFPTRWVDEVASCTDLRELAVLIVGDDETFGEDAQDCLRENIDDEFARDMMIVGFGSTFSETPPEVPPSLTEQANEIEATCAA